MKMNFFDWDNPIFLIGIFCFGIAIIFGGINYIQKKQCYTQYADFQPHYEGLITGCLVKYNGKTIPTEALRMTNE